MIESTTATDLLAAAKISRGRFAGRAELTRAAEAGCLASLSALCERLGVPQPERHWGRNEAWRRAHAPVPSPTSRERGRLQRARAADRAGVPAPAEVGRIARLARERREARERARVLPLLVAAREAAGLRTARHVHDDRVVFVAAGEERADSISDSISSEAAGMGRAYCRVAYRVATSEHVWYVPEGCEPKAVDGRVYLSDTVRVRQGRGTSLVTEHLAAGRGGRLVWRSL